MTKEEKSTLHYLRTWYETYAEKMVRIAFCHKCGSSKLHDVPKSSKQFLKDFINYERHKCR